MSLLNDLKALVPALPHMLKLGGDSLALMPYAPTGPDAMLRLAAVTRGDAPAVLFEDRTWSWRDLHEDVDRYAHRLHALGVREGQNTALLMDNRPQFLMMFHATNRLGVPAALINTGLTGPALAHAIRAGNVSSVIVGAEHAETLAQLFALDGADGETLNGLAVYVVADSDTQTTQLPDARFQWLEPSPRGSRAPFRLQGNKDVCCYIYTSGTTGLPKAAVIRNQRIIGAGSVFGRLMHQTGPGEVVYITLPLYHTNALGLAWGATLMTGATAALRRRFSASKFWDDVHRYNATSFVYIGEVCRYLTQTAPHPLERAHSLRVGVGNGVRAEVSAQFRERFGVPTMREFYGSTEGNAFSLNVEGRPGMIGRMGVGQKIVRCDPTTGELVRDADGWCVACTPGESGLLIGKINRLVSYDGYADQKETERKILTNVFESGDQWFNSGDLIRLHDGRWMSFVDRLGDTYRWKGENISTTEVAALLCAAPGVVECVVYGIEVPGAEGRAGAVALVPDAHFSWDTFSAFLADHVPRQQQPRFVRVLAGDIETTGTYKLRKVDFQKQGFAAVEAPDRLYVLHGSHFVPVEGAMLADLQAGTFVPA